VELAVNKSVQAFASALRSVYGRNGALHAAVVTVGISWSFSTKFEPGALMEHYGSARRGELRKRSGDID